MLKNEIWLLVRNISEGFNSALLPVVASSGLTLTQFRLLMLCSLQPEETVSGLSHLSGVAAANVSAICKRLEGMGLLRRTRDREDERVVHVRLTEEGVRTIHSVDEAVHVRYGPLFRQESPQAIERMLEGLQSLNTFLKRLAEVPCPPREN
jgi:DNA-binding MarR family transcriptional regulator